MTERHPDYVYGFNAGIQAAWERINLMVKTLPAAPITPAAQVMRDTALDIGDSVLALKQRVPGADGAHGEHQQSKED